MPWYYLEGSNRVGPVADEDFQNLINSGKVTAGTMVWQQGMADWVPYSKVAVPVAAGMRRCVVSGKIMPEASMIQFGNDWVAPEHREEYLQRVREGVSVGVHFHYAGFWIRTGAKIIDGLIIAIFYLPVYFLFTFMMVGSLKGDPDNPFASLGVSLLMTVYQWALLVGYNTFFIGKYGATPGKMACKLKVIMADGASVSYGRAFGRAWADILSAMICYIGYIMVAFDSEEKRALHDRICHTRVIYKDE